MHKHLIFILLLPLALVVETGMAAPVQLPYYKSEYYAAAYVNYPSSPFNRPYFGLKVGGVGDKDNIGLGANAHIGYGHVWNRLYLGGELGYQYDTQVTKFTLNATTPQIKNAEIDSHHNISLDFTPGLLINLNTLIKAYIGMGLSRYTLDLPQIGFSERKTTYSYRFGIGIAHAFNQHFSMNLNYIYSLANKFTFEDTAKNLKVNVHPDVNEVSVGLTIHL